MSMLIVILIQVGIIAHQIWLGRREHAQKLKEQAEQNILMEQKLKPASKLKTDGDYAITPKESLVPQLHPKHPQQPKRVHQL